MHTTEYYSCKLDFKRFATKMRWSNTLKKQCAVDSFEKVVSNPTSEKKGSSNCISLVVDNLLNVKTRHAFA